MDVLPLLTVVCVSVYFPLALVAASEFGPCGGKQAEVFFVLDSSGSILKSDFQKEIDFAKDVTAMFEVESGKVKVGALSFSTTVHPEFDLGQYSDKSDLLAKLGNTKYEGGKTNTAEALAYLHKKGLPADTAETNIPHIAIVLTDGLSQDMDATIQEAKKVHDAGIIVFVIGIGSGVDKKELEAIGSRPSSNYVFMIDNFDVLKHIKEELAIKACEVEAIAPVPDVMNTQAAVEDELSAFGSCTPAHAMDIVFAVDTAGIGALNARYVLQFISNVSDHINMAAGDVTISTVNNGCSGGDFDGTEATDPINVKQAFAAYQPPKFETLMRNMRLKAVDGRAQSNHVAVTFVTDRLSSYDAGRSRMEAMRAKYQKTTIFVIGVGTTVDPVQVKKLLVNGGQYLQTFSFTTLESVSTSLLYKLCMFGLHT